MSLLRFLWVNPQSAPIAVSSPCAARSIFVGLIAPSSPSSNNPFVPPLPMTNFPNVPTGRAILRAVRASMNLVGSSLELLTDSQLIAMRSDLHRTLAIVSGRLSPAHPSKLTMTILNLLWPTHILQITKRWSSTSLTGTRMIRIRTKTATEMHSAVSIPFFLIL